MINNRSGPIVRTTDVQPEITARERGHAVVIAGPPGLSDEVFRGDRAIRVS